MSTSQLKQKESQKPATTRVKEPSLKWSTVVDKWQSYKDQAPAPKK